MPKRVPFLAVGPGIRTNFASRRRFEHGSLVKTVERIFALPILSTVEGKNDFAELFKRGQYS